MALLKTVVIKDGDDECGTINVYIAEKTADGSIQPPAEEGAHVFEFVPKRKEKEEKGGGTDRKEGADDCCGSAGFGWIQHFTRDGANWFYDNGADIPPGHSGRQGESSDPFQRDQPSEKDRPQKDGKPVQSTGDDRWKGNPWYGAPTDRTKYPDEDAFARNPQPQTTIADKPGGNEAFRTQLVCVNGGRVWFMWEWDKDRKGSQRPLPKKK